MEVIVAITRQKKWHPGERGRQERDQEHLRERVKDGQEYLYSFDLVNGGSRREGQEARGKRQG